MTEREKKIEKIYELLGVEKLNKADIFVRAYNKHVRKMSLEELDQEIILIQQENAESPVIGVV